MKKRCLRTIILKRPDKWNITVEKINDNEWRETYVETCDPTTITERQVRDTIVLLEIIFHEKIQSNHMTISFVKEENAIGIRFDQYGSLFDIAIQIISEFAGISSIGDIKLGKIKDLLNTFVTPELENKTVRDLLLLGTEAFLKEKTTVE